ncbi:MAG: M48 family metallopeptidase [Sphingobacteriales bacterium]|nr:M48 family metallopeptidase [Sphingobacteriales bacterium]
MNSKNLPIILLVGLAMLYSSCSKVPVTGRRQLGLLPESELMGMSLTSYKQFLASNKVLTNGKELAMVKRAGDKLSQTISSFLQNNKMGDRVAGFKWEFNLVEDKTVNAWCMPGGKIVFYTGIMPICKDEAGVAVVMGHEIAHAIARHGNERMSQGLAQQLGGVALSAALANKSQQTQQLFSAAYGIGTQVGAMLPFSRLHESEADELGLYFMAMAGYDPRVAPAFWQRMSAGGGGRAPEFLSTHPSPTTRIANLNKWMPKAIQYYNQSTLKPR